MQYESNIITEEGAILKTDKILRRINFKITREEYQSSK